MRTFRPLHMTPWVGINPCVRWGKKGGRADLLLHRSGRPASPLADLAPKLDQITGDFILKRGHAERWRVELHRSLPLRRRQVPWACVLRPSPTREPLFFWGEGVSE